MSNSRYNSVYQRPPIPVPSNWDDMRRTIQTLESVLDDIYRRYGRLALADLNKETADTIVDAAENAVAAQKDAAAARAIQDTPDVPSTPTPEQIQQWADEAYALAVAQGYTGSAINAFIKRYIEQKMREL